MKPPGVAWREIIGADESARFQRYGEQLALLQRAATTRGGPGRALHRRQHLGLRASLEVLGDLPAHARQGLFVAPRRFDAHIRLSNGSGQHAPDRKPDVRGFGLRVIGVDGPGALGTPTTAQCFLLINSATFMARTTEDFMGVVLAAAHGPFRVLRHLMKRHGVFGGIKQARLLRKGIGKPFAGFGCETFHSAAPIACGTHAAKVRLVPHNAELPAARRDAWSADLIERLAAGELHWDLQLQFYVDEVTTPIEDPTILWPEAEAPFVTVARLVAPAQDPTSADGRQLAATIEAGVFDPWNALAEHRPLGEIMRARKATYFASQNERGVR